MNKSTEVQVGHVKFKPHILSSPRTFLYTARFFFCPDFKHVGGNFSTNRSFASAACLLQYYYITYVEDSSLFWVFNPRVSHAGFAQERLHQFLQCLRRKPGHVFLSCENCPESSSTRWNAKVSCTEPHCSDVIEVSSASFHCTYIGPNALFKLGHE